MTTVVGNPPSKKRVRYTNCAALKDPTLENSRANRLKAAKTPNIFRNQDVFSENVQHDSVELQMPGDKLFQLSPANNMLRNTFFSENKHSINSDAHALSHHYQNTQLQRHLAGWPTTPRLLSAHWVSLVV